ncbi:hypothetical protein V6N13_046318 [Hibiscus sabdariffa]|uniref:Uncharacterized protein n=2 Tax=Hibiscus sabdariffa TaxID=183260 RepID=A0ABR1ZPR9_9ROSI
MQSRWLIEEKSLIQSSQTESNTELGGSGCNHPPSSRVISGIYPAHGKEILANLGTTINYAHLSSYLKDTLQVGVTMGTNVCLIGPITLDVMDHSNENLNMATNMGFDSLMGSGDGDNPLQQPEAVKHPRTTTIFPIASVDDSTGMTISTSAGSAERASRSQ